MEQRNDEDNNESKHNLNNTNNATFKSDFRGIIQQELLELLHHFHPERKTRVTYTSFS